MVELYILLIFMIIGSVGALEAKDLLSSVVALGAVGLGLSLTFLILRAPDVAITLLVVEILSVIILIRATVRKDLPGVPTGGRMFPTLVGIGFGVVLLLVGFGVFRNCRYSGSRSYGWRNTIWMQDLNRPEPQIWSPRSFWITGLWIPWEKPPCC